MKKRTPLKLSFDYVDTAERRVLSLEKDGLFCLPVIGFDSYRKKWQEAPLHVHDECLEISAPQENLWVYSGGIGRSPKA